MLLQNLFLVGKLRFVIGVNTVLVIMRIIMANKKDFLILSRLFLCFLLNIIQYLTQNKKKSIFLFRSEN